MNHRKPLIVVVASLTLSAMVCVYSPATAQELGLDFWNVGELERQMACCEKKMAALEQEDQIVMRRMACREIMLKNLIAKRITIEEAERGFLALSKESPKISAIFPFGHPYESESERAKNQVIAHLKRCNYPGSQECLRELSSPEWAN